MARSFTKNTSNYLTLGTGAMAQALAGASCISAACFAEASSLDAGGNVNSLLHFKVTVGGSGSFLFFGVQDGGVGNPMRLRVGGRSGTGDSFQFCDATTVVATGARYHFGGELDFAGDTICAVTNGNIENKAAVTFGQNALVYSGAPSNQDMIGGNVDPPTGTIQQWNGPIAEVAIWVGKLPLDAWRALAAGADPREIMPASLALYMPLGGGESPERDIIGGKLGTITGSLPAAPHPYIDTAGGADWLLRLLSGGADTTLAATISGAGSVSASLSTRIEAAATVLGAGMVQAGLSTQIAAAAAILGAGTVTADLSTAIALAANVAGAGSVSGSLSTRIEAAAQVLGLGSVSGSLSTQILLGAAILGQGSVSAALAGTVIELGATVSGAGQVSAALASQIWVAAEVLGQGVMTGSLSTSIQLGATVLGVGQVTAALEGAGALMVNPAWRVRQPARAWTVRQPVRSWRVAA